MDLVMSVTPVTRARHYVHGLVVKKNQSAYKIVDCSTPSDGTLDVISNQSNKRNTVGY